RGWHQRRASARRVSRRAARRWPSAAAPKAPRAESRLMRPRGVSGDPLTHAPVGEAVTATLSTEAHPPSPGARSFGGRITERAAEHPEKVAFIAARQDGRDESVTWAELGRAANQTARLLEQRGATPGSTVGVAIPFQPAPVSVTV